MKDAEELVDVLLSSGELGGTGEQLTSRRANNQRERWTTSCPFSTSKCCTEQAVIFVMPKDDWRSVTRKAGG